MSTVNLYTDAESGVVAEWRKGSGFIVVNPDGLGRSQGLRSYETEALAIAAAKRLAARLNRAACNERTDRFRNAWRMGDL